MPNPSQMQRDELIRYAREVDDSTHPDFEAVRQELKIRAINENDVYGRKISSTPIQRVVVTDISMPFGSMVVFMVKWSIAALPAFIILVIIAAIIVGLFGGMFK